MVARNTDAVSDPSVYENLNTYNWTYDAYTIGTTKYDGVVNGTRPDDDYIAENIPVAESQIVLAGYRLYWVIQYVFSNSTTYDD